MKTEFTSQQRETLLFLTTYTYSCHDDDIGKYEKWRPLFKIYHSEETLKIPRQHKTQQNKKLRPATTMCWDHYFLRPNIFIIILLNFIQFYFPLSRKWVFCIETKKRHFNTFKPSKYYFTISNRNKSII